MRGIDVHVHPFTPEAPIPGMDPDQLAKAYNTGMRLRSEEEMIQEFRDADIKVLLIAFDCEHQLGGVVSNDTVVGMWQRHPETILGVWGTAEPHKGQAACDEAIRAIRDLGCLGIKFQPAMQGFVPSDRQYYPLYEAIESAGGKVLIHVGTTGAGKDAPGGGGMKLWNCHPMHVDAVAADFPNLTIVTAHPAWPWQEEMNAIALHKGNVFMELSGWAPKYFPESLTKEVNGRLQDKVMFGSDWPVIPPKRWLDEFEAQGYKPQVIEKVLTENAKRILQLAV